MPTIDFTLEDFKNMVEIVVDERLEARLDERFTAEREYTRQLVHEEVGELRDQFQNFIDNNFQPIVDRIDERFDHLEDRFDHLAGDVSELRIDMRHVKHTLRTRTLGGQLRSEHE